MSASGIEAAVTQKQVAIVGAGPAGLMAAEMLAAKGIGVTLFDAMPSVGRKFLLAGKSGLNLTHVEDHATFRTRFGAAGARLRAALDAFTGADVRAWAEGLGQQTFAGSSGRVFPEAMKASPLLRAWLARLGDAGVDLHTRHRWVGFDGEALVFGAPEGRVTRKFDAVVLALGGASWPRLGSDAAWVDVLGAKGVAVQPLQPANCGFDVVWSQIMIDRFAGAPVKGVVASSKAGAIPGEFVVSATGVEGSLIYAHAAALRDQLAATSSASLWLDLTPGRTVERLAADLAKPGRKASFANRLRKGAGLDGVKASLVRELAPDAPGASPEELSKLLKALELKLVAPRPIAEAISSAGGVAWDGVDANYMLTALPGVFVAGEMLDWEAPTGGYLITGCLATGRAAADGVVRWLG